MAYVDPSDAFSGGLEDFMMKREAAKRQKMLDDLAVKRQADQSRLQEEEIQARREDRELRRQDAAAKIGEKKLADVEKTVSQMLPGDIPSSDTLKEIEAVSPGVAHQQFPITTNDQGPTPEGVPLNAAAQQRPFVGNRIDREKEIQRKKDAAVAQELAGVEPGSPEEREILLRSAVEGGERPTAAVLKLAGTPKPEKFNFDTYVQRMYPGVKPADITAPQIAKARAAWGAEGRAPQITNVIPRTADGQIDVDALAAGAGLTREGLDMEAQRTAVSGIQPPVGRTKEGKALYTAIINRAAQYDKTTGQFKDKNTNVPNLAGAGAEYGAASKALKDVETKASNFKAFHKAAEKNSAELKKAVDAIPDFGVKFLNTPIRDLSNQLGSTDMAKFNVFRKSVTAEFARLVENPNLTGTLAQQAKDAVDGLISGSMTTAQIKTAIDAFSTEAKNRQDAFEETLAELKKSTSGEGEKKPTRTYYDANGNPVKK